LKEENKKTIALCIEHLLHEFLHSLVFTLGPAGLLNNLETVSFMFLQIIEFVPRLLMSLVSQLAITGAAGGATMKANGSANPGFYHERAAFE
jgi:hypothetical protein